MGAQMEFELGEDAQALAELAGKIFGDHASTERVVEVERDEGGFDRRLWQLLADAGVLGACLPESVGGGGMGMLGMVAVCEQQGRRVAPVPLWAALAAAQTIAELGSEGLRASWLERIVAGEALVTTALDGVGGASPVSGARDGGGLLLDGVVVGVPAATVADAFLLPVRLADGTAALALLEAGAAGVSVVPVDSTGRGAAGNLHLDGARVADDALLLAGAAGPVEWILQRARLALCAVQLGTCAEALAATAAYVSQREQFGRPLSTNQAVAVRAADAHLDTEAIRLTTWRAAWLLDQGREDEAVSAVLVAKLWASRGGLRVVHATQHLHGGIGADIDYPIHRYFLWGRQAAFSLGSADQLAAELGAVLPSAPRIGAPA